MADELELPKKKRKVDSARLLDVEMMKHCVKVLKPKLASGQKKTLLALCNDDSVDPKIFFDLLQTYLGATEFKTMVNDLKKQYAHKRTRVSKLVKNAMTQSYGKSTKGKKDKGPKKSPGGGGISEKMYRNTMFAKKWLLPKNFVTVKSTSIAWDYFYRIGPDHPCKGQIDSKGREYNYQCCVVMDENTNEICGALYHFPMTDFVLKHGAPKVPGGVTHDSNSGLKHLQRFHGFSTSVPSQLQTPNCLPVVDESIKLLQEIKERSKKSPKAKKGRSTAQRSTSLFVPRNKQMLRKPLDKKTTLEMVNQMEWYTYSETLINQSSFDNVFTRKMLKNMRRNIALANPGDFKDWLKAEWEKFCAFLKHDLKDLGNFHAGSKFAQPLSFTTKYGGFEVLTNGITFVRRNPKVANVHIALLNVFSKGESTYTRGLPKIDFSDSSAVAATVNSEMKQLGLVGTEYQEISKVTFETDNTINMNTELAALDRPIAYALGLLSKESCMLGGLEDDKDFTDAQELFFKLSAWASEMDSEKTDSFTKLCSLLEELNLPGIRPKPLGDKSDFTQNQTSSSRLETIEKLLFDLCKTSPAYVKFIEKFSKPQDTPAEVSTEEKEKEKKLCETVKKLKLNEDEIKALYEIEAVIHASRILSKFCPKEDKLTGGFKLVLRRRILTDLDPDKAKLKVIDDTSLEDKNAIIDPKSPKMMKRKEVSYSEFTSLGQKCWDRAFEAFKDIYSGEDTSSDLVATMLDLRTKDAGLITTGEMKKGLKELQKIFVKYNVQKQKAAQGTSAKDAKDDETDAGNTPGGSNWDTLLVEDGLVEEELSDETLKQQALTSFKAVISKWLKLKLDWRQEFDIPDHTSKSDESKKGEDESKNDQEQPQIDLDDLCDIDIGKFYHKLVTDPNNPYGDLPEIALCYIGTFESEEFNSRAERAVKLVMENGSSLLNKEELNKLICLRINANYMEYMKKSFPKIKQSPWDNI